MENTIKRINELAAIKKQRELTEEEKAEKKVLYEKYLSAIRGNLEAQIKNIRIVDEKGNTSPINKKPLN